MSIRSLYARLWRSDDLGRVELSERRLRSLEAEMHRRMGRVEPHYTWSHRFRKSALKRVTAINQRRRTA